MKKKFQLVDLIVRAARPNGECDQKIDGVQAASVSFIMQKMTQLRRKKNALTKS